MLKINSEKLVVSVKPYGENKNYSDSVFNLKIAPENKETCISLAEIALKEEIPLLTLSSYRECYMESVQIMPQAAQKRAVRRFILPKAAKNPKILRKFSDLKLITANITMRFGLLVIRILSVNSSQERLDPFPRAADFSKMSGKISEKTEMFIK